MGNKPIGMDIQLGGIDTPHNPLHNPKRKFNLKQHEIKEGLGYPDIGLRKGLIS